MTKDNLYFDSQDKLAAGIKKIAQAVGSTMGTGGNNAIIEAIESPGHLTTNDGYSIANAIVLADPIEDMGRKILLESINRANKASGDGSSTTCVLTAAIIEEGLKHKNETHPMTIKREIEDCLPLIEESLNAQTRHIVDKEGIIDLKLLEQVATISSEDEQIGKRIADIYSQIGKDGLIYWDISKTSQDTYTIGQGITVEGAGFLSSYMCDATESGQNTNQVRVKNPYILITKQKIASAADLGDLAAKLNDKEVKDLVVFADEVEPLVVPDLIKTRMVRGFRIIIVKMPVLWKDWWYEDLAKATGATVIDPVAGLPLKMATLDHLGRVGNIIITKEDTYLDGIKDVSDHIKVLESDNTDDGKLRASRLNLKTARYFVGAQSDSALSYRRLKVEDAISAAYQALQGGIVPGGGIALLNVSRDLGTEDNLGKKIIKEALRKPLAQILDNAGMGVPKEDLGVVFVKPEGRYPGFNSKTQEAVPDMFEAGIIDPQRVVLNAVKNAISVAATILTAPTLVTLPREEETTPSLPPVVR